MGFAVDQKIDVVAAQSVEVVAVDHYMDGNSAPVAAGADLVPDFEPQFGCLGSCELGFAGTGHVATIDSALEKLAGKTHSDSAGTAEETG